MYHNELATSHGGAVALLTMEPELLARQSENRRARERRGAKANEMRLEGSRKKHGSPLATRAAAALTPKKIRRANRVLPSVSRLGGAFGDGEAEAKL